MSEHSFRKAKVEGSTPSIGCVINNEIKSLTTMNDNDTSPQAQRILCEIYRRMTPAEKFERIFSAYRFGRQLNMAGIRLSNPGATEEQVWHIWARRHLGDELYEKVYGSKIDE